MENIQLEFIRKMIVKQKIWDTTKVKIGVSNPFNCKNQPIRSIDFEPTKKLLISAINWLISAIFWLNTPIFRWICWYSLVSRFYFYHLGIFESGAGHSLIMGLILVLELFKRKDFSNEYQYVKIDRSEPELCANSNFKVKPSRLYKRVYFVGRWS
jgi:hypothetical protein